MRFEKLFLNMRIFKGLILLLLFVHQYFCLPAFPGAEGVCFHFLKKFEFLFRLHPLNVFSLVRKPLGDEVVE